jgi:hypothetical protein
VPQVAQTLGHGQRRKDVPAGSASHDGDFHRGTLDAGRPAAA